MGKNRKLESAIIAFIIFLFSPAVYAFCHQEDYELEFILKGKIGSEDKREELFFDIADVKADAWGNIFILDSRNNCVRKFSNELGFLGEAGRQGQGPGDMNSPSSLAIDAKGNVFIADNGNMRINVLDNNLEYLKSIKLIKPLSIKKIFIDHEENILLLVAPMLKDDSYFHLYSSKGDFLKSFFREFHPFAPKMNSPKELRDNIQSLVYLSAQAALGHDRSKIAITYDVPENPLVIHIVDTEGNSIQKIKRTIKGYNPDKQLEDIKNIVQKKVTNLGGTRVVSYIIGLHFAEDGNLVLQRYNQIYQDGKPASYNTCLDLFSPDGKLLLEEEEAPGQIISIDSNNNAYICSYPERSQVDIYTLAVKKK
ncbi:MAG: hypothetical protein PHU81_03110 [Acidobacteriota bacterium]|nr:hypothetical protein [Acidobacteriota bacterium]